MGFIAAFAGTQDQAYRWVLTRFHPVLAGIVQVHVHLAGIGMAELAELADLEIDDQQALEAAMKEQQVDAKPAVV
ncbi:hypothetical protein GCM10007387_02510 [Pseudoduganella albidiflava]|uniref:Uncharacterized protein n=1 Tax=Pseudoduganella albidiflava TaxID=321983 RepID=A0AA87XST8_9BURK|nr:hypothetical protein GCM10007387_02510 [Pseudoduganella albidiflava]